MDPVTLKQSTEFENKKIASQQEKQEKKKKRDAAQYQSPDADFLPTQIKKPKGVEELDDDK